jgi:hypothetical protein
MIQLSKISQWSKEENLYDYVIDAEKYIWQNATASHDKNSQED